MKRDMDLVREILIALSEADDWLEASAFVSGKYSYELVGYHFKIMDEAGLVVANVTGADGNPYYHAIAKRLTWEGNEFLSTIKSEKVWAKVKAKIAKTTGDASLSIFKTIAAKITTDLIMQGL